MATKTTKKTTGKDNKMASTGAQNGRTAPKTSPKAKKPLTNVQKGNQALLKAWKRIAKQNGEGYES